MAAPNQRPPSPSGSRSLRDRTMALRMAPRNGSPSPHRQFPPEGLLDNLETKKVTIGDECFAINDWNVKREHETMREVIRRVLNRDGITIKKLKLEHPRALASAPQLKVVESLELTNCHDSFDPQLLEKIRPVGEALPKVIINEMGGDLQVYEIPVIANADSWEILGGAPEMQVVLNSKVKLIELKEHLMTVSDLFEVYQKWKNDEALWEPPMSVVFSATTYPQTWQLEAEWGSQKKIRIIS